MMEQTVLRVDRAVDLDNALEGAQEILNLVRPDWDRKDTCSKIFDNGITNKMFGFYQKDDECTTILVRVNGAGTELYLERAEEVGCFELLHRHGCAPTLYCIFNNGLCYEYIQGNTLTKENVASSSVYKSLTSELAKMHCIPSDNEFPRTPRAFPTMRKFIDIAFEPSSDCALSNSTNANEEKALREEVDRLELQLKELNSPVVFCHNDLLLHNVIYNSNTGVVKFIDYEYAGFNYQAFDIGNHFCEFAGLDDVDYRLYPSKSVQFDWLRCYVTALHERCHPGQVLEKEALNQKIEVMYKQVNKFALAAHLFWGIWALVQARYSKLDFDYKTYSQLRLNEYAKRKEEFLAL